MQFIENDVLYLFCDASITKLRDNGITLGCPGVIVSELINDELVQLYTRSKFIYDTTNNNSEINAILLGVLEAIKNKYNYKKIRLISDSLICIMSLKQWILAWIKNINNGILYSSTGQPVANQDVIIHIIQLILNNNLNIEFYHQKGHVTSTKNSLKNAKEIFCKSNGILLDSEEIKIISDFNNMIDKYTKEQLMKNYNNTSIRRSLMNPFSYNVYDCDFNKYQNLISYNY